MTLNTVSSEPHISLFDHLNSPVFFVSLALHLFVFPCVFSRVFSLVCFIPTVISHCVFFRVFFHSFFLVFPTHPRTLSPQSALPQPFPSLFIQGLVSLVLCLCLKIGLGRETLSSENNKSVRLILCLQYGIDRKLSTCAAICRLRRVAPGHLRLALPDSSIGRRSYMQSDIGKALFLTLKKALEQGMIGNDKDFSRKVCVKWKDTEFEQQVEVRSKSLIPRGDAIHAQAHSQQP